MRVVLVSLVMLAYPALVYFGLERFEPRVLALLLAAVAAVRALVTRERMWAVAAAGGVALAAVRIVPTSLRGVERGLLVDGHPEHGRIDRCLVGGRHGRAGREECPGPSGPAQ